MMQTEILPHLLEMDADLLLAINGWRAVWADCFMYAFSGKLIWIPMYASIFYVLLRNLPWKVTLGCIVTIVLTIVLADQVGSHLIRPLVCRLRPANLENPLSEFVQVVNGYRGGRYGFPSCHAANTFGLAFFVFYVFRNRLLTGFIMGWAILTCYSRAYLGVHYPGDLLVGGLIGFAAAWVCFRLFLLVFREKGREEFRQTAVPVVVGGATVAGILIYAIVKAWH